MDKYFTNEKIANICCSIVSEKIKINYEKDIIIEPSAGNGAFMKPIKRLCKNSIFFDIQPENSAIKQVDFLTISRSDIEGGQKIHVIGNPPFGFKGSMAIKFIKNASTFCDTMSFILPRSFGKDSMKRSVPCNFHLLYSCNLPENSFNYNENVYNIPCIFQIWEKRTYMRKIKKNNLPSGYVFLKDFIGADFAIRRVGSLAGHIYFDDIESRNLNSHYFIKLDKNKDKKKIKNISLKSNDYVVGPRSISKKDIISQLNKIVSNSD